MTLTTEDGVDSLTTCCHPCLSGVRTEANNAGIDNFENVIKTFMVSAFSLMKSITWDRVRLATSSDPDHNALVSMIESGMPDFRQLLHPQLREHHKFREQLCTIDGVLCKNRVVNSSSLRQDMLDALHVAHQGVTSMVTRAEVCVQARYHTCHHCTHKQQ